MRIEWDLSITELKARQIKELNQLLDGLEGKLTSSQWARLGKCSRDTAIRDINALMELDTPRREPAGGRSTCYVLTASVDS